MAKDNFALGLGVFAGLGLLFMKMKDDKEEFREEEWSPRFYRRRKAMKETKKQAHDAELIYRKYKGRKGPAISATSVKRGTRRRGNDGKMWVVRKSGKSQRWFKDAESFEEGDYDPYMEPLGEICEYCNYEITEFPVMLVAPLTMEYFCKDHFEEGILYQIENDNMVEIFYGPYPKGNPLRNDKKWWQFWKKKNPFDAESFGADNEAYYQEFELRDELETSGYDTGDLNDMVEDLVIADGSEKEWLESYGYEDWSEVNLSKKDAINAIVVLKMKSFEAEDKCDCGGKILEIQRCVRCGAMADEECPCSDIDITFSCISCGELFDAESFEVEDSKEYCILCASYDDEMKGDINFEEYLSREHESHHTSLILAEAIEKMQEETPSENKELLLNVQVIEYSGPNDDDMELNWWTDDWGPEISRDINPSNLIYDLPQAYVYEKYSSSPTKALARYDEGRVIYYSGYNEKGPFIEVHIPNINKGYKNNILSITPSKR